MIEWAGIQFGTVFQGGTLAALVLLLGVWWVRGMPDRGRVRNEAKVIADEELARRYKEWRAEVHELKNQLAIVLAEQRKCNQALSAALALNRPVLFLIRLLIREVKRLDPTSPIIDQAETTLEHLGQAIDDPNKSDVLNAAEQAVEAAEQTVEEAKREDGAAK